MGTVTTGNPPGARKDVTNAQRQDKAAEVVHVHRAADTG